MAGLGLSVACVEPGVVTDHGSGSSTPEQPAPPEVPSDPGDRPDPPENPEAPADPPPSDPGDGPARQAFVHLFEWRWTDIARECELVLGPAGVEAVQISPPNEHGRFNGSPWWQRYQPVSYRLDSRSGTRDELVDMVERCAAVGVGIYADAVINHMTGGGPGPGWAGSPFTHYDYPGLYSNRDFHQCGTPYGDIGNYGNRWEVQNCELVNLADLRTEDDYVRSQIGGFLADLVSIGVAGFRLDASKHMPAQDIEAVLSLVPGEPFVFQEVIDLGGEPISAMEYTGNGQVTDFRYGMELSRVFRDGELGWLESFGGLWDLLPSDVGVVFIDNHDNQRGHGAGGDVLTHRDGALYDLANVFMLAWPHGHPKVMSSYRFTDFDAGPPATASGETRPSLDPDGSCAEGWECEHRRPAILGMMAFRNHTHGEPVVAWWSDGANRIAFGRGDKGFVVINRTDEPISVDVPTELAPGVYCNAVASGCDEIEVGADGRLRADVAGMSSVALHVGRVL